MNEHSTLSAELAFAGGQYTKERDYWLEQLSGPLNKTSFPYTDSLITKKEDSGQPAQFTFSIKHELAGRLLKLSGGSDTKLYVILAAGLFAALHRYTGETDIIVGTAVYKPKKEAQFLNTILALRDHLDENTTFKELLVRLRKTIKEAMVHVNYPYEKLLHQLAGAAEGAPAPLFDTALLLESVHNKDHIRAVSLDMLWLFKRVAASPDPVVSPALRTDYMEGTINYNPRLYSVENAASIADHYCSLLENMLSNIDSPISGLPIYREARIRELMHRFNNTEASFPSHKSIQCLFRKQVERIPDATAVVDTGNTIDTGEAVPRLTYAQLDRLSTKLAEKLIKIGTPAHGVGLLPGTVVAVSAQPSIHLIVAVLAILKIGAAYMPINPDYPTERKRYMLEDAAVSILLTDQEENEFFTGPNGRKRVRYILNPTDPAIYNDCPDYDSDGHDAIARIPAKQVFRPHHGSPTAPAYIIYTSGSTGKPKGVVVEHHSVVRLVKNTNFVQFQPGDRILQTGALEFDASTFEIWGALLNGLQLYLAGRETVLTPEKLKHTLAKYEISTIWMTAPLFNRMVDADIDIFKSLKNVLVGGDTLSPPHINQVRRHFPHLAIINGYGPTENTTFSTTFLIPPQRGPGGTEDYHGSIPIGTPITNSTAVVIDKYHNLVPVGVPGELAVGGEGVARGYLNAPEKTAEKFIPNPFPMHFTTSHFSESGPLSRGKPDDPINIRQAGNASDSSAGRLYKTGDLVRRLPDGNLEFIGRIDQQIKIRGFRVEMGEIEHHLLMHPQIKEAMVLARTRRTNDKYLCAYFTLSMPGAETEPNPHNTGDKEIIRETPSVDLLVQLKQHLSASLPAYMIPDHFIALDQFPLNTNGKIDRSALPEPGHTHSGQEYQPPANDTETRLQAIWVAILEQEAISVTDDFFKIGGHSLSATTLAARIHKEFNIVVPLAEIFTSPTIRKIAQYIKQTQDSPSQHTAISQVEKKEYYELSPAQHRIYFNQTLNENSTTYNMPQVIPSTDSIDIQKVETTFKQLIHRHESLRTSFHMVADSPVQRI
ncbi:MAG: amino acid adenylation domain-containing protein, partial [bacterium]|nr:amino acid adenylation domain-containing protein [bacterium]